MHRHNEGYPLRHFATIVQLTRGQGDKHCRPTSIPDGGDTRREKNIKFIAVIINYWPSASVSVATNYFVIHVHTISIQSPTVAPMAALKQTGQPVDSIYRFLIQVSTNAIIHRTRAPTLTTPPGKSFDDEHRRWTTRNATKTICERMIDYEDTGYRRRFIYNCRYWRYSRLLVMDRYKRVACGFARSSGSNEIVNINGSPRTRREKKTKQHHINVSTFIT